MCVISVAEFERTVYVSGKVVSNRVASAATESWSSSVSPDVLGLIWSMLVLSVQRYFS